MNKNSYLIVGLGSIGKRHLKNLRELQPDAWIVILRNSVTVTSETDIPEYADAVVGSLDDALAFSPKAAIIATPASHHISIAKELVKHDIHLMVEKPLSDKMAGVSELVNDCSQKKLALFIGYNFRFSKSAQRFKAALEECVVGDVLHVSVSAGQYLPDWRPGTDYRLGVSARADLGGGATLELSHELDYIRWFFGEVSNVFARASTSKLLKLDVEDCVDALLTMNTGIVVNLHLDFLQQQAHRSCKVIGSEGVLEWDVNQHRVTLKKSSENIVLFGADQKTNRNDMYLFELQHFISCVIENKKPLVTGADGLATLRVASGIKQSSVNGLPVDL